ncbi:MAG: DUF2877 domain-containing protein [Desulfovibrio sp.]
MKPARVIALGCQARKLLERYERWRVLACFERCAYLAANSGQRIVCLAHDSLGNGPLNILLATALPDRGFMALIPPPGSPAGEACRVRGFTLHVAGLPPLCLDGPPVWSPAPFPEYAHERLGRTLQRLAETVLPGLALPGVAGLLFPGLFPSTPTMIDRELASRIEAARAAMDGWFCDGGNRRLALLVGTLKAMVGMGRGLTPSGDDFIGGVLLALHAMGEGEAARVLYGRLVPALEDDTNVISRALLACAAKGLAGEGIHDILAQLSRVSASIGLSALNHMGHTSGWDTFLGIASAMSACSKARTEQVPR